MKTGDKVAIRDLSWSRNLSEKEGSCRRYYQHAAGKPVGTLVATGLRLYVGDRYHEYHDCIVQFPDGVCIATHTDFLREVYFVHVNAKRYPVSVEVYNEVMSLLEVTK